MILEKWALEWAFGCQSSLDVVVKVGYYKVSLVAVVGVGLAKLAGDDLKLLSALPLGGVPTWVC